MADRMVELTKKQDVFFGIESARDELGITISYWRDLSAIKQWKESTKHSITRERGRNKWHKNFKVRIAKVERDYDFKENNEQIIHGNYTQSNKHE